MAINVSYKNKIGYFTLTQKNEEQTSKFRIHICHANAMCAMMYFYTNEKGEEMVQLHSFASDIKHAKECIKRGLYDEWDNFVFHAKECNTEMWKFIRLLAENGKKVTIK